jgi:hypothetical protein
MTQGQRVNFLGEGLAELLGLLRVYEIMFDVMCDVDCVREAQNGSEWSTEFKSLLRAL